MKTMLYYVKKYGNTSFSDYDLNEMDSAVFSQLAYLNFDTYLAYDESVRLVELFKGEYIDALVMDTVTEGQNIKLLKLLGNSTRYNNVRICNVKNIYDELLCIQFFGMTLLFEDFAYVLFRGTDASLTGWKEDFNMCYLEEVPSQRYSIEYINDVYNKYKCKLRVAGHSKGGNLAVCSVLNSDRALQDEVISVINFDGPGFSGNTYTDPDYLYMKDRIFTFTTREAMIGLLLNHVDNLIYIRSRGVSLLQHNLHNWKVNRKCELKRVRKNSPASRVFGRTIRHFFEETDELERKQFVDVLFKVLEVYPSTSINHFKRRPFNFIGRVTRRYRFLAKPEKKFLFQTFKKFRKAFYKSFFSKLKEKFSRKKHH